MDHHYIKNNDQLNLFCDQLKQSDHWFTIDTEFMREKTYFPQPCLIQIANNNCLACIDIMQLDYIEPLLNIIYNPSYLKIFHAAYQDMEIFYHMKGDLPKPIFDTQVAAAILGLGEQIGYAGLVMELTSVKLSKKQSRTNWSKRPLDNKQIEYALNDVRYLRDIYFILKQKLEKLNRLDWMNFDLDKLTLSENYAVNTNKIWLRLKHIKKLQPYALQVAQILAKWREEEAIRNNKPRQWIIDDNQIYTLCKYADSISGDLGSIPLPKPIPNHYQQIILELIASAKKIPPEEWPTIKKREPLTNKQESLISHLAELIKDISQSLSVNSTSIATRKDLERLVLGQRNIPLLYGWRYEIAGKAILSKVEES